MPASIETPSESKGSPPKPARSHLHANRSGQLDRLFQKGNNERLRLEGDVTHRRKPRLKVPLASAASPCPGIQIVLLGVMYPSSVPQRHQGGKHDESRLPPEILANRRSTDLNPIPTSESGIQSMAERRPVSESKGKPCGTRHPVVEPFAVCFRAGVLHAGRASRR